MGTNNGAVEKTFTPTMATAQYKDRKFKRLGLFENLTIEFKWAWFMYKCECCQFVKQEIVTHLIHTVEIFEPLRLHDDEVITYQVWLGYTQDGKVMSIPELRRGEVEPHLKR
jgi:hypothetical protein